MNFAEPKANILQMGVREGMKIGDFGVGSGHYALAAAGIVGRDGKVYAIDVQEDLLHHVRDVAMRAGRTNIDTIWGDIEKPGGTKLRDGALDAVILSNILFQLDHPEKALLEARRTLKPGGKLLVIDWAASYAGLGPAPERVVPEHKAEELCLNAGFHKQKNFRAGAHHYGLVFTTS